jgi:hypothetical protein
VVYCEVRTEGSDTAKSGTDEQKRYMRLQNEGKQAHHCNVQRIQTSFWGRCRRNRRKEEALTGGDLTEQREKSAEVIVTVATSPNRKGKSYINCEGPNIKMFQIKQGLACLR